MRKSLALVAACCALAGTQVALADGGSNPTPVPASPPATVSCTPLKTIYAPKNWRDPHPTQGENPCLSSDAGKLKARFFQYRTYRLVAPFHGPNGHGRPSPSDGRWWAIPWHIVCGESGGNFWVNADGAYQIIPSTWSSAGGTKYAATAGGATPLEQHIIAHKLWGTTPWYGDCA
jgi:Transglycosylase-like domain